MGDDAGPVVLRLVDCSLLVPPRTDADGRARYRMLQTLRSYGAGLLAEAEEQDGLAVALAGFALAVAEEAAAGLQTRAGEMDAARWLDAEDATMRQVLVWAMEHDPAVALRLAVALGSWWFLRGRLAGQYSLLREAVGRVPPGSEGWCAVQPLLGWAALFSVDLAGSLGHFTALRDAVVSRPPSQGLADALVGRSAVLRNMRRSTEAVDDACRALALAREMDYSPGEAHALAELSLAASHDGDHHTAVELARQAEQITGRIPGSIARVCSLALTGVLIEAGELTDAERVCAAGLAWSRDASDLGIEAGLLSRMVMIEMRAGRLQDAAAHLHAAPQIAMRIGRRDELINDLYCCGYLCAETGRHAEAVTIWAALDTLLQHGEHWEPPAQGHRRHIPLFEARQALESVGARVAEERGAAMSLATMVDYALMLTDSASPQLVPSGPRKLSARERELVTLVAQGRTNAQIAAQLYISIRTVSSHLDRIRDKTGCRRRTDLTRLALTTGLV